MSPPGRAPRRGMRPTRDGWGVLLALVLMAAIALVTGNNLIVMLLSILLALVLVEGLLGSWNLRGVDVQRELPAELFVESVARGRYRLRNTRRWLPSSAVWVQEQTGGGQGAVLERLGPLAERTVSTGWRFDHRGQAVLGVVRLRSVFPFGLVERWVDLPRHADLLIYPQPRSSPPRVESGDQGEEGALPAGRGGQGDFDGLDVYRPGDRLRAIHWPTTARVGRPMVLRRTRESADRVMVRVQERRGLAWEAELSRACGEVLRGFHRGHRVGLELPGERLEPKGGPDWRRYLLERLARQPSRGA